MKFATQRGKYMNGKDRYFNIYCLYRSKAIRKLARLTLSFSWFKINPYNKLIKLYINNYTYSFTHWVELRIWHLDIMLIWSAEGIYQ